MPYKVIIIDEKLFARDLEKIDVPTVKRLYEAMKKLEHEGRSGAKVKKLKNYAVADYRLRVGSYRVLLNISEEYKEIHILRVLHRSKLY